MSTIETIPVSFSGEITATDLERLLEGKLSCIIIKKYVEPSDCESLADRVGEYIKDSNSSGTIYKSKGDAFFNTLGKKEIEDRYFASAISLNRELRNLSKPNIFPLDKFRLELDEAWYSGASLLRFGSKALRFGICRVWDVGAEGLPHQDILRREVPGLPFIKNQKSQLGVNVYLRTANEGGELEIWDHFFSEEDCKQLNIDGSYGFSRNDLPLASQVIKPECGDLIIVNTTRVHAIRKIISGQRITLSGFIGYWGNDKPMFYWS